MSLIRLRNTAATWVLDLVVWQTIFKTSGKLRTLKLLHLILGIRQICLLLPSAVTVEI
jgi:hypothetical protein